MQAGQRRSAASRDRPGKQETGIAAPDGRPQVGVAHSRREASPPALYAGVVSSSSSLDPLAGGRSRAVGTRHRTHRTWIDRRRDRNAAGVTTDGRPWSRLRQSGSALRVAFVESQNWLRGAGKASHVHHRSDGPARILNDPASSVHRSAGCTERGARAHRPALLDTVELAKGPRASTLSEAATHANSLRAELHRRGTHRGDALLHRRSSNATHFTSLEAAKSVSDRIRTLTGVTGDGSSLVDATLTTGQPNSAAEARDQLAPGTITEADEQKGFANLCLRPVRCFATLSHMTRESTGQPATTNFSKCSRSPR